MASSASAAYQTWRQFSGDAKAPVHMNLRTPGVATQQADIQAGPSVGDQLNQFAQAAGNFFQAKTGYDQSVKAKAEKDVDAWMARHTMAEYRQKMREGNVPFQNDPVSMDVLHNNAAYGIALEVEEAIQNKVKAGEYKTLEEADKARIEALEGARSEYSLSMGISPDNKAFRTGFNRDEEKRRQLLVGLQTDVTDKFLRTQAKVNAQSTLLSPLTDDFVGAVAPNTVASYIVGTINQQKTLGQLRSDQDVVDVVAKTVESLKGTSGGAAALESLGGMEMELFGAKGKLRDHLGGGVFDAAVLGAMDREQQLNADRQAELNDTLIGLQRTRDIGGLLKLRGDRIAASGGKTTREISEINQVIKSTESALARENAAAREQHSKNLEKQSRLFGAVSTYRQLVAGDLAMVSLNYADMGLKDRAEASEAQQFYLNSIKDPQEKFQAAMKLASYDEGGFASNALMTWDKDAGAGWDQYVLALQRGDTNAVIPDKVKYMQDLYTQNPEAFTGVYKNPDYIQAMELGRNTGMSTQDVALAQVAWKKLPEAQKKEAQDVLTRQANKAGSRNPAYVNEAIKNLAAPYLQMGIEPEKAIKMGRVQYENQTVKFMDSPIHKSFFQLNGEKSTYEFGKSTFELLLPEAVKSLGDPGGSSTAISYDQTNQKVFVHNLDTGESRAISQADVQAKAAELQKAAEEKSQKAQEAEIKAQTTATERNTAQKASMNRLEGVNFYR